MLEAVNDKEFRRAMGARDLLACRKVVPDVFEAVLPMVSDSDSAVRTSAMTAAAYCPLTRHSVLTPAQRTFLGALLACQRQPFDETLCRTLLGG